MLVARARERIFQVVVVAVLTVNDVIISDEISVFGVYFIDDRRAGIDRRARRFAANGKHRVALALVKLRIDRRRREQSGGYHLRIVAAHANVHELIHELLESQVVIARFRLVLLENVLRGDAFAVLTVRAVGHTEFARAAVAVINGVDVDIALRARLFDRIDTHAVLAVCDAGG